ncbi:transport and Golgi organization protein 1 homolog isoform X1 [Lepisosteus oculatus]|uniref:transport and Golgi organization protein 1 homolog isoform X1 n=1 Tax=Lepisosteus oculatus TaxID=7918 RepID=UPI0035F51603
MAAVVVDLYLLVILFIVTGSEKAVDKRFSDIKRCNDDECSMLMCRGKAAQDFYGPDCRFLTFKKGETIYVYYKLSGKRNDLWAGSVGSRFGYFPKDLLEINHIYSVKELEIPAEETDFVCFDGQLGTFDSYDVDQLLGSSVLLTENDTSGQETAAAEKVNQGSNAQNQVDKQEDDVPSQISPEESDDTEKTTDDEIHLLHDNGGSDVLDKKSNKEEEGEERELVDVRSKETSQLMSEKQNQIQDIHTLEGDSDAETTAETTKDDLDQDENMVASHEDTAEDNTTKDKSPSLGEDKLLAKDDVPEKNDKIDVSEVQPASNLKTTIGSTFDAVTTDDENTQKVTPFYDDFESEGELLGTEQDEPSEASEVTPLLSYSEDNVEDTSEQEGVSDSSKSEDRLGYKAEEMTHGELGEVLREDPTKEEMKENKSMWTSLGDTVFAIVSGADRTNQVTSLEDEDEEDDFELDVAEGNEDPKSDTIPLLGSDVQVDHGELPHSSAKETVSDEIIQEIPDDKVTDEYLSVQKTKEREGSDDNYKLNQELDLVVNQNGHASKLPFESDQERKLEYENMPETPGRQHDNLKVTLVSEVQDAPIGQESGLHVEKISDETMNDLPSEEFMNKEAAQAPKQQEDIKVQSSEGNKNSDTVSSNMHSLRNNQSMEGEENGTLQEAISEKTIVPEEQSHDELTEIVGGNQTDEGIDSRISANNTEEVKNVRGLEEEPELKLDSDVVNTEQTVKVNEELPVLKDTLEKDFEHGDLFSSKADDFEDGDEENEEELLEDENAMFSSSTKIENLPTDADEEELDTLPDEDKNVIIEEGTKETQNDSSDKAFGEPQPLSKTHLANNETEAANNTDVSTEKKRVTEEQEHTDVRETSVATPGRRPIEEDEESTNTEEKHAPSPEHLTVNDNDNLGQQEKKTLKFSEEKEHGDSITEITLLKGYFDEKRMERISKFLSPQHILRVEAMFNYLDQELKKARQTFETIEDIEKALDSTLESSENRILDEIERMLDARELKNAEFIQMDGNMLDEEADVLDDFQELAFQVRQKYSAVSDSTPLMSRNSLSKDPASEAQKEKLDVSDVLAEIDMLTNNHTSTRDEIELQEKPLNQQEDNERPLSERRHSKTRSDIGVEEDGGHFNRNKDSHFMEDVEEIQKGPPTTLENTLDIGLGIDVEHPSSGFLESPKTPDYSEDEKEVESQSVLSLPSIAEIGKFFTLAREYLGIYTEILVGTLPEEWQPGPTFYGLPWQPVIVTAMVGLLSFLIFFWRTLLAVKSRTYLLTEKQLVEKIKQLIDEKSEALSKISELNKLIEEREQQLKVSEKSKSSAKRENKDLQDTFKELQRANELMKEKVKTLNRSVEEERKKNRQQEEIITETQKSVDKFQSIIKSNRTELSKVQALVEEAKLREEALKAELQSFEKENNILKSKKKALLKDAKDWEEKHRELSEQIKVFQKSQKELEDTVVHKENEIEVLSNCIAELQQLEADAKYESADLQKGDAMILANGEALDQKNDTIKNRIKQMMDVSWVKTTLTIVQEERDHYFTKLLAEEKERHELEEQIKKLEHDQATMLSEKCHLESQFKTIQQKLEIMNEMYQQKENALQQKLTQEEFERREKEQKLSEVDGKALQAEEELKTCKQRIQEIEEELQKTERSYKNQIASHEKKAHENWLNARSAERALVEEKRETANLRQKLIEVNEKLAELQRPSLIKPTPGRPDRQLPPFRKGDSFGPSPVSGGAPSPPPMFEGPGRPPSAPLGRREPFGPVDSQLGPRRPPSETLGRFSDLGHPPPSRPDAAVSAPRTSSPSVLDGSQNPPVETQALPSSLPIPEVLEPMNSKSQGPPSFPGTPIMNSPASGATPPAKGFAPPLVAGPFPPSLNGPTPPPLLGPLNGHPPMPSAVPPLAPGPRYGPPHPSKGPYGPRPYGAVPPHNVRGPVPPHRDYPPGPPPPFGPRDLPAGFRDHHSAPPLPHGHRDYPFPAKNLPPGGIPPPGVRDYPGPPPPAHLGPRDFPAGPPPVPNMAPRDYPGPGGPAQQAAPRDTSSTLQNEP